MFKTINVKQYETYTDSINIDEIEYAVNHSNEGLWCNGHQIFGTADFNAQTPKELMRKLRARIGASDFATKIKMIRNSARGW